MLRKFTKFARNRAQCSPASAQEPTNSNPVRLTWGLRFGGLMLGPWWRFSLDTAMLAVEAQSVIAMRLTSSALGRGSHAENTLMVTEKVSAFVQASTLLAAGASPHKIVRGYRRHVRANARRLVKEGDGTLVGGSRCAIPGLTRL